MGMRLLRHEQYEHVFVCSLHEMDPRRSSPCMQTDLLRELGWKTGRAFGVYGGLEACKDIYLGNRSPERLGAHMDGNRGQESKRQAPLTAVGVIGHGDDAHGLLGDVHSQQLHVTAHVLVGPLHCPPYPVSPENMLSVHSQPKGVDGL